MLIYQKQVSFAKLPNPKQIKVFDKHILNRNLLELDYTIKQKSYVPKFQQPETNWTNLKRNFTCHTTNDKLKQCRKVAQ